MKNLETSITINATTEAIWEQLMAFDDYSKWNPFIKHISGKPEQDARLEVSMQLEGKKPMTFKPKVLISQHAQEFRWLGKMFIKGLFDGEHYFKLERISDQETRLVHGENFRGILSGMFLRMIGKDTLLSFDKMNQALKQRLENEQ